MHRVDAPPSFARLAGKVRLVLARDRQRHRSIGIGLALLIAILLAGGVWASGSSKGAGVFSTAMAKAGSIDELFAHRSPGNRTVGELVKSKTHLAATSVKAAKSHPLSRVRPPLNVDLPQIAELMGKPDFLPATVQLDLSVPGGEFPIIAPPTGASVSPGTESSPMPGGSIPATTPGTEPRVPVETPPAVPEPQSWAMMLLGFAALGCSLRRRRKELTTCNQAPGKAQAPES